MANTVNVNSLTWDGYKGAIHYALTSDGTAITDTNLVDISTLAPAPASIRLKTLDLIMSGNFEIVLEFDATTDQEIDRFKTQTVDESRQYLRDYCDMPNGGRGASTSDKAAAGFTGDLLITAAPAASDTFSLLVTFEKDS